MQWVGHLLGLDDASGGWYLWWSGIGADLGYLAIVGGLINLARRHNCHTDKCWRIGHYDFTDSVTGLVHRLCRRCHPDHPGHKLTLSHIQRIHRRRHSSD
jgi:hypothetical protein